VIGALGPAEISSLVLAGTGAVVLALLFLRHRAGRALLRPIERPFRATSAMGLLLLAGGLFVGYQAGGLLVLEGGATGDVVGNVLPLGLALFAGHLAHRYVLLPRVPLARGIGMGLLHVWASLPLVLGTFLVCRLLGLPEQPPVVAIRDRALGWQALAFSAVVVAPVAEEVCFRGLIYPALRQTLPVRHAILFTSLAFALVHPPSVWVPMAIFAAFLAWLVETTGSVVPSILGHAAFNGINVLQILLS